MDTMHSAAVLATRRQSVCMGSLLPAKLTKAQATSPLSTVMEPNMTKSMSIISGFRIGVPDLRLQKPRKFSRVEGEIGVVLHL